MRVTNGKVRVLGCAVATVAAFTMAAGTAQADTQTTACSSNGLLSPILGNPTCTTAPINASIVPDGADFTYTARGTARSLLLPAGVKVEFIVNGSNLGQIAACNTNSSTCTATFTRTGTAVPLNWHSVQARCTWTNKLAVTSGADCRQTLTF